MKAIILAAGYATRMYPLTLTQPKALLPLGGRAIIDYIVDQLNTLPDINEIIVVSNHKFIEHFKRWHPTAKSDIPITILDDGSTEEDDRLGAIGDIRFTLQVKKIKEDVVVIAGDNFITYPLREQYDLFKSKNSDVVCAKVLHDRELLQRFAVATLDENNKVIALVEKPQEPPTNIGVYATYFFQQSTFELLQKYIQEGKIQDAPGYFIQWLHRQKDVYAYIMNGDCYDIGTIHAYKEIQLKIEKINTDEGAYI